MQLPQVIHFSVLTAHHIRAIYDVLNFFQGIIELSIQGNGLELIAGHITTNMVGLEMDLKQDFTDSSLVLVVDGVEIIQFNSQAMNRFNLSVQAPRKFS